MTLPVNNGDKSLSLNQIQKAAVLLMSLETQSPGVASKVFSQIGEKRSKRLMRTITELGKVDSPDVTKVVEEFYELAIEQKVVLGGRLFTQKLLKDSFGVQEQDDFFSDKTGLFDFLSQVSEDDLYAFLQDESDQFVALLFSFTDDALVARLMTRFSTKRSSDIVQLLLHLDVPNQNILWKLSLALEDKLLHKFKNASASHEKESVQKLSRALEIMAPDSRTEVLDLLRKSDQAAVEALEKMIFSFDDFATLDNPNLKLILYEVDPLRILALALNGVADDFKERVMSIISDRVRLMLQEELDLLPENVSQDDIQKSRNELVYLARRLEKEGRVELRGVS